VEQVERDVEPPTRQITAVALSVTLSTWMLAIWMLAIWMAYQVWRSGLSWSDEVQFWSLILGVDRGAYSSKAVKATVVLCPPKPKAFVRTAFTSRSAGSWSV